MTRLISPLDPRIEVRHVGDRELDQLVLELVEPARERIVTSGELRRAIREGLAVGVDEVRVRAAMGRVLEHCDYVGPGRSGLAFGTLRQGLTAHQRMAITHARLADQAAAAQPRPLPAPAPRETSAELIDRLLG